MIFQIVQFQKFYGAMPRTPPSPQQFLLSGSYPLVSPGHLKMLPKTLTITKVENTIIIPLVFLNVT